MSTTRRHQRYKVPWLVQVRASDWGEAQQLALGNVSRGGLFVRCDQSVPVGSRVEVLLQLPEQMVLRVEGEVVHSIDAVRAAVAGMAAGFGLRFDERYAIDLNLLEGIAASNSAGAYAFAVEEERYISLAVVLVDEATGSTRPTTAHKLVEQVPGADSGSALAGFDEEGAAEVLSLPGQEPVGAPVPAREEPPSADAAAPPSEAGSGIIVEVPARPATERALPAVSPVAELSATAPRPALRVEGEPCFGIDFGTTYTSIAIVEGNRVRVLQDAEGQTSLPSVVCFPDEGPVLVGWPARQKVGTHPSTTISSPKRLLGRQIRDPNLQPLLSSSPVHFREGRDGLVQAEIFGEPVSITRIVAEVLRRISEIGEAATLNPVRRVVLSAPVTFSGERESLRRAAEEAGLDVAGFIDEPVSAAMAFGMGMEAGRTVAVYDFGGGTLDFTVLRNKPRRGYEVLGKAGEPWLGGDDFDRALASYAAEQFMRQHKVELRERGVEWQRLLLHCEQAKRRLSVQRSTELRVRAILLSLKGPIDLVLPLDRALLDQICGGLVERSLNAVKECLADAGLKPAEVDQVVLTGGTSRSPQVRRRLQELFGREITVNYDPELAIVSGNALYGRFLALKR